MVDSLLKQPQGIDQGLPTTKDPKMAELDNLDLVAPDTPQDHLLTLDVHQRNVSNKGFEFSCVRALFWSGNGNRGSKRVFLLGPVSARSQQAAV